MYHKIIFLIVFSFFSISYTEAQEYPTFKITARDTASKGYYFLCPIQLPTGNVGPTHVILDSNGKVVYFKHLAHNINTSDFKIQPNAKMTYTYRAQFSIMDSSFNVIDSVLPKNGLTIDTHDFQILPNGHYLFIGSEFIKMDLSAYKLFNHNGTPGSKNGIVKCGVIQEQDQNKKVVFEWHCKDYYSFDDVDPYFLGSPDNVDWTHMNSVEVDKDGNILISVRHFNEITKINRRDSSIIWRLGGKRNQFKFTNDSDMFFGQHDIRRIVNGNVTLYDNGRVIGPFHASAAKEYNLDEDNLKATLVWKYVQNPNLYSTGLGNVQRLPNGNTLVDYGKYIKSNIVFDVIKPKGTKIFGITSNDSLISYRSFNYLKLPWGLKRPEISCFQSEGKFYLDAGTGHKKYLWSNGETNQTIQVAGSDTYNVMVPIGDGGYISSADFITLGHTVPCSLTSINSKGYKSDFSISPNPVENELIIDYANFKGDKIDYQIFDLTGKMIIESFQMPFGNHISIPVNNLHRGIYMLKVNGFMRKIVKD